MGNAVFRHHLHRHLGFNTLYKEVVNGKVYGTFTERQESHLPLRRQLLLLHDWNSGEDGVN